MLDRMGSDRYLRAIIVDEEDYKAIKIALKALEICFKDKEG